MPKWEDYKAQAKQRGALALELYAAESTPAGTAKAVKEHLPAHLSYQSALEAAGKLALAGPLSDASGEWMEGTGLIIYRAQSLEAARALADADPMHATGARRYTLRRWLVNEGWLALQQGTAP